MNLILAFLLIFVVLIGRGRFPTGRGPPSTTRGHRQRRRRPPGFVTGDRIVAIDGQRLDVVGTIAEALRQPSGGRRRSSSNGTAARSSHGDARRSGAAATERVHRRVGRPERVVDRPSTSIEAVPESFSTIGEITADTGAGIGRLFSPAGIERYSKNFTGRTRRSRERGFDTSVRAPSSGSSTSAAKSSAANVWSLLFLLGADQPLRRPVQPHPAAAVRRGPRCGRHLRAGRVQDPGTRGAGRLPQARSRDRARPRRLPHARSLGDVPRYSPDLQRILIASPHTRFARSGARP